jgi:hypothetical protein
MLPGSEFMKTLNPLNEKGNQKSEGHPMLFLERKKGDVRAERA